MRRHGDHWHRLIAGQQARYEQEAARLRATRKETIQEEISALRLQLQGERESVREDTLECSDSMVISACKWTPPLLDQFDAFLRSDTLSPSVLADLRLKARTCPPKTAPEILKRYRDNSQLKQCYMLFAPSSATNGSRLQGIGSTSSRLSCGSTLIVNPSACGSFVMLNPLHVAWTPLTVLDLPTTPSSMLRGDDEMGLRDLVHA
eukprot:979004-Amphidinium_carterae.1